ncbi:D-alanyl-D-alanine carboxypeptidase family protein [Actinobacillus arthritidis]|uniref:D-alanyl-D-alanine carboxypeptidase family protein n=1 Tax=Actinobacillus arthritidis TaxID=157339 RepID=UPI0024420707|nr:serine hydrolase [Actinobacillus arthritidis]WGE89572.1 serine hydrolase [Actinobacillus arthritidis]
MVCITKNLTQESNYRTLIANKGKLAPFSYHNRGRESIDKIIPIDKLQKNILFIQVNNAESGYLYYLRNFYHEPNDSSNSGINNGWGFVAVKKDTYGHESEQIKYITLANKSKYRIEPNTGIVEFTIYATDGSDISFDIILDTTGLENNFRHLQTIPSSRLWGYIIDEAYYNYKGQPPKENDMDNTNSVFSYLKNINTKAMAIIPISSNGNIQPILIQHNLHTPIPPASTTKILTALIALESGISLDTELTVIESDIKKGSGNNLKAGDLITLEDALYNMMSPSSNTSAELVARSISEYMNVDVISYMNEKAQLFGMQNSYFVNPTGLASKQNTSTAYDLAMLCIQATKNEKLVKIFSTPRKQLQIRGQNARTIEVVSSFEHLYENTWFIGGKSGTLTPAYFHMLSWVQLPQGNNAVIFVASQSAQQRLTDTIKIYEYLK